MNYINIVVQFLSVIIGVVFTYIFTKKLKVKNIMLRFIRYNLKIFLPLYLLIYNKNINEIIFQNVLDKMKF